ncbi:MAG: M64 family metallopeptidase, partial [bacterium]
SFGIQRLITISGGGQGRVDSLLQLLMPEYDIVIMIVNDPEYGGSGGFPAITSINASAPEIVVHELGHSFAGLGDEYSTPFHAYPDIEEPNTTQQTRRDFIKWRAWILNSTPIPTPPISPQYAAVIGLFEGAHYHDTGWFRPKLDCKMRVLGVDFCEVCAEALVKSKYELIPPIESFSPPATNITLMGTESVSLGIVPLKPATHALSIQWHINGISVNGATSSSFLVSAPALGNGTHQVKVKVVDNTNMVRNDPARLLSDSTSWRVTVSGVTAVAEKPSVQLPQQYWLEQNYPNPLSTSALNSATTIRYALPRATHVKLAVYNVGGQPVTELVNGEKQPGVYQARLEIERLANGIYFYRLQAEGFVQTKKFILLK